MNRKTMKHVIIWRKEELLFEGVIIFRAHDDRFLFHGGFEILRDTERKRRKKKKKRKKKKERRKRRRKRREREKATK